IAVRLEAAHPPAEPADAHTAAADLAGAYLYAGRVRDALALLEQTAPACQARLGPDHPTSLVARMEPGLAYDLAGRSKDAIRLLEEVVPATARRLGPRHPDALFASGVLALAYSRAGRAGEAADVTAKLLTPAQVERGPDSPIPVNSFCI